MITLYEVLEVSEKASDEVIEKAYKVLAKRYHPDLQPPEKRKQAEEKMKQINDAYETLMNKEKRQEYDEGLIRLRQKEEIRKQQVSSTQTYDSSKQQTKEQPTRYTRKRTYEQDNSYENAVRMQKLYQKELWKYKIKKLRDSVIAIGIILFIILLLWLFPPTHKWMVSFYEDNIAVKIIVDAIASVFQ